MAHLQSHLRRDHFAMEKDKIESRGGDPKKEEATAAEKTADQNRRKRLLRMIIEYHMRSISYFLYRFERRMDDFEDEDFVGKEEILEDMAGLALIRSDILCNVLDSHKWKSEKEADWHYCIWGHHRCPVHH
jgi:hypothetical protein